MVVLFPSQPFSPRRAEPDFAAEFEAARTIGFAVALYDHDALEAGDLATATKYIPRASELVTPLVLRGWMLTGQVYGQLFAALRAKGYSPLTSPDGYAEAHYLPLAYRHIEGDCGRACWIEGDDATQTWLLYQREFAGTDCIIKDWVKSAKAKWKEGCFIPRGTSEDRFKDIFRVFRKERGHLFNRGVVLREFLPIVERGSDIRGLPLVEEVRLFFWRGTVLVPPLDRQPTPMRDNARWQTIAERFSSPFITIDVAYLSDGTWRIVEVGEGSVSGLPIGTDPTRFYASLWNAMSESSPSSPRP